MDSKIKIIVVIGARPQFIKHAAFEIAASDIFEIVTIHTGQHYDKSMSSIFFDELGISQPNYMLNIGSANHGVQTGRMMIAIEEIVDKEQPKILLVYGDTNSTLAGALVAVKLNIPVVHIEAGLRSHNQQMPEEINRVLTDHISTLLFCPNASASINLSKEGIESGVFVVGDIMCDMIRIAREMGVIKSKDDQSYYFATIHRPYNTDDPTRLLNILTTFNKLDKQVIFAIHPRTSILLNKLNFDFSLCTNILFISPVSYFESLNLQYNSAAVITDSGGIQKEAYMLKKKCVTLRSETEWEETLIGNWNNLVFNNLHDLNYSLNIPVSGYKEDIFGDGFSCIKIIKHVNDFISKLQLNC